MNTNTFYKTFSGTDAIAFMIFGEAKPILLGSLTTLSHSVYREKKPVPLLGKINTGGYTRGMRSIAGTMVFTLINQHLVEDISEQIPYIQQHGKLKADELPFFDIMIICANEYGAASQMMIYGAEFFEDGQVISIQDLYIENTFSFVARDIDDFARINPIINSGSIDTSYQTETLIGYAFSKSDYDDLYESAVTNLDSSKNYSKVSKAQNELKNQGYNVIINGVENVQTVNAIKQYQLNNNLSVTGELNDATYSLLANNSQLSDIYKITNKNGAYVYSDDSQTHIIGIIANNKDYVGIIEGDYIKISFGGITGYILITDTSADIIEKDRTVYKETVPSGKTYTFTLKDFVPTNIGADIKPKNKTEFRTSTIAYYDNGEVSTSQRFYTIDAGETKNLNISYLSNSFVYNENNGMPYMVEYIITPISVGKTRKWIIKFKE